jgi:Fe-S cluster assembly scaffold protein SufB
MSSGPARRKSIYPIQALAFTSTRENLQQNVHNLIIAREGSELHIITGLRDVATHEARRARGHYRSFSSRRVPN